MSNPVPSKNYTFRIYPTVSGLSQGQVIKINSNSNTNGLASFVNSSWMLPSNLQSVNLRTLQDLITTVSTAYVKTNYSVGWSGDMYPTRCLCTTYLNVQPTGSSGTGAQQTIYSLADGETNLTTPQYVALNMPKSPDVLMSLTQNTTFSGGDCHTCSNSQLYTNAYIYVYVDVTVDMYDYCTVPGFNNIYTQPCYDFIGNYCEASNGCDTKITNYLIEYCSNKYPGAQLDLFNTNFDDKDYKLCGCNMPTAEYDAYGESLAKSTTPSITLPNPDQCYFPACRSSNFMPANLLGCPGPNCVNTVLLNNNVLAGPVTVNQNDPNCEQYVSTVSAPGAPGSSLAPNLSTPPIVVNQSGSPTGAPSKQPSPSASSGSFWSKYWGYIVGIIIALLILMVIIVVVFVIISKKKKSGNKKIEKKRA